MWTWWQAQICSFVSGHQSYGDAKLAKMMEATGISDQVRSSKHHTVYRCARRQLVIHRAVTPRSLMVLEGIM